MASLTVRPKLWASLENRLTPGRRTGLAVAACLLLPVIAPSEYWVRVAGMVGLYTMQSYAEKNPDIVRRVVRATQRATKEMHDRPVDEVMAVLQPRYSTMDPKVLRLCIEAFKPSLNVSGAVTREMAQNVLDFMPEAKGITVDQYMSFYTDKFLKD